MKKLDVIFSHHVPDYFSTRCLNYNLFGKELHFCARCTGVFFGLYVVGLIACLFFNSFLHSFDIFIMLFFAMPAMFDWGLQSLKVSERGPKTHLVTGFFMGFAVSRYFATFFRNPFNHFMWLFVFLYFGVFLIILLKKVKKI